MFFEVLKLLKNNFVSGVVFYQIRLDRVKNESLDKDDLRVEHNKGKDELDSGCWNYNRQFVDHDR